MKNYSLPIGLEMALSRNPEAMQKFVTLSQSKKQQIIDGTHSIKSKEEMHEYVNNILTIQ